METKLIDLSVYKKVPKFIAVEGPIGAGKTTLASLLSDSFGYDTFLEKPSENPFLPDFYINPSQAALATQLFFLFQRANQLNELKQKDFFNNGVIADFFLQKDPIFARLNLDNEEFKLYVQIYKHLELKAPIPDLVIYLQTPVDLLRRRVAKRNIGYEQKISTEYLERIAESYSAYFHNEHISNVLIVNNEDLDFLDDKSNLNMLIERILSITSIREYFNPRLT